MYDNVFLYGLYQFQKNILNLLKVFISLRCCALNCALLYVRNFMEISFQVDIKENCRDIDKHLPFYDPQRCCGVKHWMLFSSTSLSIFDLCQHEFQYKLQYIIKGSIIFIKVWWCVYSALTDIRLCCLNKD